MAEVAGIRERVLELAERVRASAQAPARVAVLWAQERLREGAA